MIPPLQEIYKFKKYKKNKCVVYNYLNKVILNVSYQP